MVKKNIFPKRIPEPTKMKENEQKEFEKISGANNKRWHLPLIDHIIKNINFVPSNILDVGCGPGIFMRALSKRFTNALIVGVDIEDSAIKLAKKNNKNNKNLKFIKTGVSLLPFKNDYFDVVISKDSLHEFYNPKSAIIEMIRVTRPSGIIIIQDLRRDLPYYLIKRVLKPISVFEKLVYYSTRASYTKAEVIKILKDIRVKKYTISTKKITTKVANKYKSKGINLKLLKESFQSRYTLVIKKENP